MVLIWALQRVLERFEGWKACLEYRKEGAGGCVYRGPDASAGPLTSQPQRNSQQLEMEARKVQMRNKLQVFNSEQLSPRERERRSRFPAFQVFQHTRGAFLKKKKKKKLDRRVISGDAQGLPAARVIPQAGRVGGGIGMDFSGFLPSRFLNQQRG